VLCFLCQEQPISPLVFSCSRQRDQLALFVALHRGERPRSACGSSAAMGDYRIICFGRNQSFTFDIGCMCMVIATGTLRCADYFPRSSHLGSSSSESSIFFGQNWEIRSKSAWHGGIEIQVKCSFQKKQMSNTRKRTKGGKRP